MKRVKARKDEVVRRSNEGVEKWLKNQDNCTVYKGHARFEGSHAVRVGTELLEAEKIFINVGARPARPPIPGLDNVDYLTNSEMMGVDYLPEHLIILGGNYIGLKFGQMYRRFGSRVTIIQRGPRLLPREDEDVSQAVREILESEDIAFVTDTTDHRVEQRSGWVVSSMNSWREPTEIVDSHLLV